jgi:hypothetical protein
MREIGHFVGGKEVFPWGEAWRERSDPPFCRPLQGTPFKAKGGEQ